MGCSSLNAHLSLILHVKDDCRCACGHSVESPKHYFLECPLHAGPRADLMQTINEITDCNINILLFGNKELNFEQNCIIFQSVHKFIKDTNRF